MKVSDVYFSCYKLTAQVGGLTQDKLSFLENILQFCTSTKIRESLSLLFFSTLKLSCKMWKICCSLHSEEGLIFFKWPICLAVNMKSATLLYWSCYAINITHTRERRSFLRFLSGRSFPRTQTADYIWKVRRPKETTCCLVANTTSAHQEDFIKKHSE